MTSLKQHWTTAIALAALAWAIPAAFAQDSDTPGIVRISDIKPQANVQPASFHGHQRTSTYSDDGYSSTDGYVCDHCQNGRYLFGERYCKNSPDHGYSPPAKYPLHRRGVQYNAYFPNQWYGQPGSGVTGSYPMVYQPTDTTQLGYTYQHVRSWQPNPNMLPQRPVPAQWHIVAPAAQASRFHGGGWGANSGGHYCENCPIDQGTVVPSVSPTQSPMPVEPAPNVIRQSPEAALPPSPREIQNAAESDHIRRATY